MSHQVFWSISRCKECQLSGNTSVSNSESYPLSGKSFIYLIIVSEVTTLWCAYVDLFSFNLEF